MERYRVLIADDHSMFRDGLKKLIVEHDDIEVAGEANDGNELLDLLKKTTPDMVVLDLAMPNLGGIEATREITANYPDVKVLMLTMYKDKQHFSHAFAAGASGYLLKENAGRDLFAAIDTIRSGGVYISPILSQELAEEWVRVSCSARRSRLEILTGRERSVLKLVAEGKSNKEIAGMLNLSVRTVESHRAHMMKKLKVEKTADLVRYAVEKGYV